MPKIKNRPVFVTVISILGFISSALSALMGVLAFLAGIILVFVNPNLGNTEGFLPNLTGSALGGIILLIGILIVALAFVAFLIAKGLWNGKNWARITQIVLSSLAVLFSLGSFTSIKSIGSGIISLAIHGAILYFLILDKEVVNYYK